MWYTQEKETIGGNAMKKLTLFLIIAAMLIGIVGLTAQAAGNATLTSAWGYEVPSGNDDFKLGINQSGDIIVAEMTLINQESDHALYATLSYKKPDGTLETSDIKLINAYRLNPTPCVYFYIDRSYAAYCDMFVTFIDRETLKPYVKAVNVNEHFNIEQDKYEANGVVTAIDPVGRTIEFTPNVRVVDRDGNAVMDYRDGMGVTYTLNGEYVDADAYLMHNVDILFAVDGTDYTLVNITDANGGSLVINAENLAGGKASVTEYRSVTEYYESADAATTTKIDVEAKAPVFVNGYDISARLGYPLDLYTLLDGTDAKIEFVENTDDKYYDAVVVTVYEHGIVESVSASSERIVLKIGDTVRFDSSDLQQRVKIVDEFGRKITLSEIKPDDVLAMRVGLDYPQLRNGRIAVPTAKHFADNSNVITIIDLGNKTVSGTVERVTVDGDVYIGGTPYKCGIFADDSYDLVYDDNGVGKIGTVGLFYLDINNRIIGFSGRSGGEFYGYILQAEYSTSDAFTKGWQVKLLTEDNKITTYDLNAKITINDVIYDSSNLTYSDRPFADYGGVYNFKNNVTERMVKYKLNDGKLSYLSIISDAQSISHDSEYNFETGKISGQVLSDDAIVFNLNSAESDKAKVTTVSSLKDGGIYSGAVADKNGGEWRVFVITEADDIFDFEKGFSVVVKSELVTYDGEDAYSVTYYGEDDPAGNTVIFTNDSNCRGSVDFATMSPGDVFVMIADENGVVESYTVLAQMTVNGVKVVPGAFAAAYRSEYIGNNGFEYGVDYICGYISAISRKNTKQIVDITYGDGKVYTVSLGNWTNMYSYTSGRHVKISAGDWYLDTVDLPENEKCSPVFVKLYDGAVTDIYTINTRVNISDVIMGSSERTQGGQTATVE